MLFIHSMYNNLDLITPNSQSIPPPPPLGNKSVVYKTHFKIPWRRAWQPTPVFLPGESHGERSLAGYSPWGCKELDMIKATSMHAKGSEETRVGQEAK